MMRKSLVKALLLVGIALLSAAGSSPAGAQTIVFEVNSALDAVDALPGDGACAAATGECTLRAAIMEANANPGPGAVHQINVSAPTVTLSLAGFGEDDAATGDLDIKTTAHITGIVSPPTVVFIDGAALDRVFHVQPSGYLRLENVGVKGGRVSGGQDGGGILINGGTLVMERCLVQQNQAEDTGRGGGIFNDGGVVMNFSSVAANASLLGGGIYNRDSLSSMESSITENTANGEGGGIFNDSGTVDVTWVTIYGNHALGSQGGGGIYSKAGTAGTFLTDSLVAGNSAAGPGGGIANESTVWLVRTDVNDNTSPGMGGGVFTTGTLRVMQGQITRNSAEQGGGIYNVGDLAIEGGTLKSNVAMRSGGGIENSLGSVTIEEGLIEGNTAATEGAGIRNVNGKVGIHASKVQGNTAADPTNDNLGGGIFNYGELLISYSSITGNSADFGGGILSGGVGANISNSLLAGNSATVSGGAIYNTNLASGEGFDGLAMGAFTDGIERAREGAIGTPRLPHGLAVAMESGEVPAADASLPYVILHVSTLNGNGAPTSGGAIYTSGVLWISENTLDGNSSSQGSDLYVDIGGTAHVESSIFGSPGQMACGGEGTVLSYGFNLEFGNTCGLSKTGDQIDIDPLLFPLADNGGLTLTQALQPGSPAIDEGSNFLCGAYNWEVDQRGQPRVMDGRGDGGAVCDIGAFEVQGATRSFEDVPEDHWAYGPIEQLYEDDYIAGCSVDPRLYCPDVGMNRAEASVFVERGIHGAGYEPEEPSSSYFTDVPLGLWFTKWVQQLWVDGYTAGCSVDEFGNRQFCPYWPHTRAEATVFFMRMLMGPTYEPPTPTSQAFEDVPIGEGAPWYSAWVNAAHDAGLIGNCEDIHLRVAGMFHPNADLRRSEGACMMVNAMGLGMTP